MGSGRRGLIAGVLVACALPACAHAAPTQQSIFMDDDLLLYRGDEVAGKTLDELKALGVTQVRLSVSWRAIAPDHRAAVRPASLSDPQDPSQYDPKELDSLDTAIREAGARGIDVLLNPTGGAPIWATDGKGKSLQDRPNGKAFGQFVAMLGRRYDGTYVDENQFKRKLPRVTSWSIWNEPNAGASLQPQWVQTAKAVKARGKGKARRKARPARFAMVAPVVYRSLARGAIAGLQRTGHGQDAILLGETAPRGAADKGTTRGIRPVPFLAAVLCVDPVTGAPLTGRAASALACSDFAKHGALAVTAYAHHPYCITSAPDVPDPDADDITLADRDRLYRLLDAAAAAGRLPAGLPVDWTEFGWQTKPDPIRGVDPADQARWLAQAEAITRNDPRAIGLTQFLMVDTKPRDEPGATLERIWGTYQTGLRYDDGTPKPGYDAYRLPLALLPGAPAPAPATPTTLWGLVRPSAGTPTRVTLTFQPDGAAGATDLQDVDVTDPSGAFTVAVTPPGHGVYRFRWTQPAPAAPAADPGPFGGLPLPGAKKPPDPPAAPSHLSAPLVV